MPGGTRDGLTDVRINCKSLEAASCQNILPLKNSKQKFIFCGPLLHRPDIISLCSSVLLRAIWSSAHGLHSHFWFLCHGIVYHFPNHLFAIKFLFQWSELGIIENKKVRKKRERKHALDQESGQERKFLDWFFFYFQPFKIVSVIYRFDQIEYMRFTFSFFFFLDRYRNIQYYQHFISNICWKTFILLEIESF